VRSVRTTRCCTTAVLIVVFGTLLLRSQAASFFPVRTRWSVNLEQALGAPPLVTDTYALLPLVGDRLIAVNLSTGLQAWDVSVAARSRPAVDDGRVFALDGGGILALNLADGSPAWRLPIEMPLGPDLVSDEEWVVAGTTSGTVLAIRPVDGHLVWQRDIGARLSASSAFADGRIYLPLSDGRIVAVAAATGETLWERRLGDTPSDILALSDRLYVGSADNYFYCLGRDGKIKWRWRTGGDVVGLAAADDRRVYFVSRDNMLRALDRQSGAQQWRRQLPIRPSRGPVRLLDMIVVSGSASAAQVYRAKDGQPAGVVPTAGAIAAAPLVLPQDGDQPSLVVVTDDLIKGASVAAIGR
jgi:outer membrane protein assembly factor BamB